MVHRGPSGRPTVTFRLRQVRLVLRAPVSSAGGRVGGGREAQMLVAVQVLPPIPLAGPFSFLRERRPEAELPVRSRFAARWSKNLDQAEAELVLAVSLQVACPLRILWMDPAMALQPQERAMERV